MIDLDILKDELEEIVGDTHDIDVQDKHYAENIVKEKTNYSRITKEGQYRR